MAAVFGAIAGTAWLVNRHLRSKREGMDYVVDGHVDTKPITETDVPKTQYGALFNPNNKFDGRDDFLQQFATEMEVPSDNAPQVSGRRATYWMPRSEEGLELSPDNYEIGGNQLSTKPNFAYSIYRPYEVNKWRPDLDDVNVMPGATGQDIAERPMPHEGLLQTLLANADNKRYEQHLVRKVEQQGRATATGSFQYAPPGAARAANDFTTKRKNTFGIAAPIITPVQTGVFTLPADAGQRYGKDREYKAWNDLANPDVMLNSGFQPVGTDSHHDRSEFRVYKGTRESDGATAQVYTGGFPLLGGVVDSRAAVQRKVEQQKAEPRSFFKSEMGSLVQPVPQSSIKKRGLESAPQREYGRLPYGAVGATPPSSRFSERTTHAERAVVIPGLTGVSPQFTNLAPGAAKTMVEGVRENTTNLTD